MNDSTDTDPYSTFRYFYAKQAKKTEDDMLKVRNLGKKSLDEVIYKLESYGLKLADKED